MELQTSLEKFFWFHWKPGYVNKTQQAYNYFKDYICWKSLNPWVFEDNQGLDKLYE